MQAGHEPTPGPTVTPRVCRHPLFSVVKQRFLVALHNALEGRRPSRRPSRSWRDMTRRSGGARTKFSPLVRKHSDCSSHDHDGNLGWFGLMQMYCQWQSGRRLCGWDRPGGSSIVDQPLAVSHDHTQRPGSF
ncbi:hypothetical protein EDB83DRAFT_1089422 [Lactarius deliciosus]|nr:hypothetical protein EDB83DRAFT_1089422 [Lactarius deliciosus]